MQFKNEEGWDEFVANNSDPYGSACIRYAKRWAEMREEEIASGRPLSDIAKETSHAADIEGITGFMYGCAVSMLSRCWVNGEELRRWSNKDLQIGNEGDEANETGGVLNPAILTIG